MLDDYTNEFAAYDLFMQRAMVAAIEQFMLALVIVIAAVTALALLALLVGLIWEGLKLWRVAAQTTPSSVAITVTRHPALPISRTRFRLAPLSIFKAD